MSIDVIYTCMDDYRDFDQRAYDPYECDTLPEKSAQPNIRGGGGKDTGKEMRHPDKGSKGAG